MALSWYQRSRSNPYAYHTTSGQYARAPLWPLPLPASLPRWEVVLVSAPSASAGAAGTVGAASVSFAGPRPLLGPSTGPATRLLPRHPPSRFLPVQKPGYYSRLGLIGIPVGQVPVIKLFDRRSTGRKKQYKSSGPRPQERSRYYRKHRESEGKPGAMRTQLLRHA